MLGVEESCWQAIREWLIAVGTVGAVLVALFWEPLRERWKQPKLDLSFDPSSPDATSVEVEYRLEAGGAASTLRVPSHWLRLNVSNKRRRRSAHEVRVLLTSVHRLEDGDEEELCPLDTVALIWSNRKQPSGVAEIPPGIERRVDVASLAWPAGQTSIPIEGTTGCLAELQVTPEPSAERHRLPAGLYRLELALSARDVDARRYTVVLSFDGEWHADATEIAPHFTLEGLRSEP